MCGGGQTPEPVARRSCLNIRNAGYGLLATSLPGRGADALSYFQPMRTMKVLALIVVLVCPLTGCYHYRTLEGSGEARYAEVNRRAAQMNVVVRLRDGERIHVEALRMAPDSTAWITPGTAVKTTVATKEITRVELSSGGQGAIEGLGFGLLTGTIIGGLLASGSGSRYFGPSFVLGSFLGLSIGVAMKSRIEYHHRRPALLER